MDARRERTIGTGRRTGRLALTAIFMSTYFFVLTDIAVHAQQTKPPATGARPAAAPRRPAANPAQQGQTESRPSTQNPRVALGPNAPASPAAGQNRSAQPPATNGQRPQQLGPAPPPNNRAAPPAVAPKAPFELTKTELERLDQILSHWEKRSGQVQTFSCRFKRWHYDQVWVKDQAQIISEGAIRYSAPDKGELRVEKESRLLPPKAAGGEPEVTEVQPNEHWICDGKSVFQLDSEEKKLVEMKLPAEMQGKQIADGPLPFMFGAEKQKLLQRYWIHEIKPPKDRKDEYWLEIFPRFAHDATNFQRVIIILDREKFLPIGMNIDLPENGNASVRRDAYQFFDRSDNDIRHKAQQFLGSFIAPQLPRGWTKEVIDEAGNAAPAQAQNPPADNRAKQVK